MKDEDFKCFLTWVHKTPQDWESLSYSIKNTETGYDHILINWEACSTDV